MNSIHSIAIFCGSNAGIDPIYAERAYEMGSLLAKKGIRIIYGGSKLGLMGAVAKGALEGGGEVIGVIPTFLKTKEVAHEGISKMVEVENMHQRKLAMHEMSDAVITLPGGFGTMEEFFEMITWGQLGLHKKPIGLLNVNGFYSGLAGLFELMVKEKFLKKEMQEMVLMADSVEELLSKLDHYKAPDTKKWLDELKT